MATIERFEDIDAWQRARKLTKMIYALTNDGQFARDFGLRDQIRRASVSIMSNLAEGFEEYKQAKKKLKVFRLEAVRAGFKKAWQECDYQTIINVAEKIPNKVLEEDPKLLMWYDQAVTRMGGEA